MDFFRAARNCSNEVMNHLSSLPSATTVQYRRFYPFVQLANFGRDRHPKRKRVGEEWLVRDFPFHRAA
jgi:hypothetical protein